MHLSNCSHISGSTTITVSQMGRTKKKQETCRQSVYRYNLFASFFYRTEKFKVNGPQSDSFNRRTYELPIESLKYVKKSNIGFTNQILCQKEKNSIRLFIPVSFTMKIKNIQQIRLGQLLAKIGCVIIVFIYVKGLPEEIVQHLSSKVMVQINRGDSFLLRETKDSGKITLKRSEEFLTFTIRETFPVQVIDDVFLSPFQIIGLVFTVTLNSTAVLIKKNQGLAQRQPLHQRIENTGQKQKIKYNISFNSMRHPLQIPITYATDCRLGVYDLAEQLLEIYSTNKSTYQQTINSFEDFVSDQERKSCSKHNRQSNKLNATKVKLSRQTKPLELKKNKCYVEQNFFPPLSREDEPLQVIWQKSQENKEKSVRYFQYTHFIIPLYKLPANSFCTIFIPMFMLSVLSIFIFLQQEGAYQEQIGQIATFVLAFIELIPSIKAQLPPSQRITISQIIVYVESVNCLLSLPDKFANLGKKRRNVQNDKLFQISMMIHLVCFLITMTLLLLHYFVWQKRYNLTKQPRMSCPSDDFKAWNNPYCDQQFLKYNQAARQSKLYDQIIVPWPIQNLQNIERLEEVE